MSLTLDCTVHFKRGNAGRKEIDIGEGAPEVPVTSGNIPRVTRLMALAIKLDRLVAQGEVIDYADLARLGHVTRARITQIMSLLLLAPDIQEAVLFLPRTLKGRDRIQERDLRPIAVVPQWNRQRKMWNKLSTEITP